MYLLVSAVENDLGGGYDLYGVLDSRGLCGWIRVFLDALDGSLCNLVLFAELRNFTGQHCTAVCQFRWSIFSPHLLNDFRPLCGKGFYLPRQALAVVHDCLQRGELVVVDKGVFCKDFLGVFPDALQFRAIDT